MQRVLLWSLLLLLPLAATAGDTSSNDEEPATPVCRYIRRNSLAFCSMVDYVAVVDTNDLDGAAFDARAKFYYDNTDVVLQRFGCHARYSLYKCDDCRDAYKYWVCSIKFQKCGSQQGGDTSNLDHTSSFASAVCSTASTPASECMSGTSGRHRTCLSICEDVVRKCPYVLNFQCPTTDTPFFSADIDTCNKLDRTHHPDRPELLWPGTFAMS